MTLPTSVAGFLAALFLAAAGLCVVSLWRRRGRHEGAAAASEANHVVMSLGMAAMVLPATMDLVPPVAGALAFGLVGAAWAVRLVALRVRGRPLGSAIGGDRCAAHPTHLLLSNAAMTVMYVAMVPSGAMAGMSAGGHTGHGGGAGSPLALTAVSFALAVYLILHTVLTVGAAVRSPSAVLVTAGGGGTGPVARVGRVVDTPAVQLGCQAVTGAGMALMLLLH